MRRIQQGDGREASPRGIEDVVDPVTGDTDRDGAELPAIAEEMAARIVTHPEQVAVHIIGRPRAPHGIVVAERDGPGAARVERNGRVAADRFPGVHVVLRAALRREP